MTHSFSGYFREGNRINFLTSHGDRNAMRFQQKAPQQEVGQLVQGP